MSNFFFFFVYFNNYMEKRFFEKSTDRTFFNFSGDDIPNFRTVFALMRWNGEDTPIILRTVWPCTVRGRRAPFAPTPSVRRRSSSPRETRRVSRVTVLVRCSPYHQLRFVNIVSGDNNLFCCYDIIIDVTVITAFK